MNRKGTTLMETLTAIFILSIAGLMITSGFVSVIRMTGEANVIKDQGDLLLSYAEKSDSEDIKKLVKETSSPINGIVISNHLGNSVRPKGATIDLRYKTDDKVSFKKLKTFRLATVYDLYQSAYASAIKYDEDIVAYTSSLVPNSSYNDAFKNFTHEPIKFPQELLPKSIQGRQLYIQEFYPWEIRDVDKEIVHGERIIFLSYDEVFGYSTGLYQFETFQFIFDFGEGTWYYQPSKDYKFNYDFMNNLESKTPCIRFKNDVIDSYNTFKGYLKSKEHGWKRLDKNAVFDIHNPDAVWK